MSERMIGNVIVGLKAQDEVSGVIGKIQGAVGSITGMMSQMGGVMGDVGNIIGSAFSGFTTGGPAGAALGAGTAALGAVVSGIQSCVKEATASEAVWASLGAAVERSGASWQSLKAGTESALLSMSKFTTYSDEQVAQTMERLMTFGLSYDQAMKALGPTLDFAAAKHMDLESAATLVGKAVDGNTGIMKRYGVDVEVAKDAADKMTPVLSALNDQFGGAAQAAANTYAGTQERLNNAWGEVQEKVGNIVLPALASLTEAMIPVVDNLGKGVDAVSAWLGEVAKMPEVQGFMAAVNDAFKGFWDYLQGLWCFIQESFGPALKELWSAFKDLWDALSPIGDALKELLGVFGDTGNVDLLKAALEFVVIQIRGVAFIIKEVAPYIKAFAQAFKEAADFIGPILTQIVSAIRFFTDSLRTIFQDFYNWLIGKSLWIDMWSSILTTTTQYLEQLFGNWQAGLNIIQGAISQWGTAAVNIMTGIMGQLQGAVGAGISAIHGMFSGLIASAQGALGTIQGLFAQAQSIVTQIGQGIVAVTKPATDQFQNLFNQAAAGVVSAGKQLYDWLVGRSIWPEMFGTMESITSGAINSILTTTSAGFASVLAQASGSLQQLSAMQQQAAGMAARVATVAGGYLPASQITAYTVPAGTFAPNQPAYRSLTQWPAPPTGLPSDMVAAWREAMVQLNPSLAFANPNITVPVNVNVDGQTVARTVEQRMISQRQLSGGY